MKFLVTILLALTAGLASGATLDYIEMEVFDIENGAFDGGIPLGSPHRGHFTPLSYDKMSTVLLHGGTSTYNLYLLDSTMSKVDSLNLNDYLYSNQSPNEHDHITWRNDTLFYTSGVYTAGSYLQLVEFLIIPATGGSFGTVTSRTPTLTTDANGVFIARFQPFPDSLNSDSGAFIMRGPDPRAIDVSAVWTTDLGQTVGSEAFVADVSNDGRLGGCPFNGSIAAGVYNVNDDFVIGEWDRSSQTWSIDSVWTQEMQRWFDLQSIHDTVLYATVAISTGYPAVDTLRYAAKYAGGSWTYGDLRAYTDNTPRDTRLSRVESSGRMVAWYGYDYGSGNDGVRLKWASPADSLQFSTQEYTILGDSINLSESAVQNRFGVSSIVHSDHGDVAYLFYTNPPASAWRIVRVTFVGEGGGEDPPAEPSDHQLLGGSILGGSIW